MNCLLSRRRVGLPKLAREGMSAESVLLACFRPGVFVDDCRRAVARAKARNGIPVRSTGPYLIVHQIEGAFVDDCRRTLTRPKRHPHTIGFSRKMGCSSSHRARRLPLSHSSGCCWMSCKITVRKTEAGQPLTGCSESQLPELLLSAHSAISAHSCNP